jgi:choline dehydrogenase-like flavoprotein
MDFIERDFLIETGGGSPPFSAQSTPGFGVEHKRRVRDEMQRTWGGGAILRDKYGPGRVSRDKKGNKVIDYSLDDSTRAACRLAMTTLAESALAGGAERVWFPTTKPLAVHAKSDLHKLETLSLAPADLGLVSYHPQGTARLNAVTDNDGRVRGTDDLYVMDTSLFPTPVGVNPQISVMAVSTMLSRRLAERLRS